MGETFLLIPRSGLRIAFYQDKQLSQPTPIAYYIMTYAQYPHGHIFAYRYNTLGMDASLRYLLVKSKLRSSIVEDNVQKTSFSCFSMKHFAEIKLQHAALAKHEIHYVLTHPSLRAGWIGCKGTTKFAHLQILSEKVLWVWKVLRGKFCLRTRRSAYY